MWSFSRVKQQRCRCCAAFFWLFLVVACRNSGGVFGHGAGDSQQKQRELQSDQSSNNIGALVDPNLGFQNPNRQITADFEYEVRSSNPQNTMNDLSDSLHTDLYRAINNHDGDTNPTLIINRVSSDTIGDCVDATSENCVLVRGSVLATLNRPQFAPFVAIQGMIDVVERYIEEYSLDDSQIASGNSVRFVFPSSVSTTMRIGFRQFESVINENERNVISSAFRDTVAPMLANTQPSYVVSSVDVIVQDVRNTFQYDVGGNGNDNRRKNRRQRKNRRNLDLITEEQDLVLWTDLFVRGHCRVTDASCNDGAFNETLYSRLPALNFPPNGGGDQRIPGLDILYTNLQLQGRDSGTRYFEGLRGVVLADAQDDYYAGIDINDEKGLLTYEYRDPDEYDTDIPLWLWLFLFGSIIIIAIGVPALFCAQHQWEQNKKRRKQQEDDLDNYDSD